MPELPEVETIRLELQEQLVGKTIHSLTVFQKKSVEDNHIDLIGCSIDRILRLGKYLIFHLSQEKFLIFHLKMSGRILLQNPSDPMSKHLKLTIGFKENIRLDFHDVRKFGRAWMTHSIENLQSQLGIEPVSDYFTYSAFEKVLLKKKKTSIKPFLLDQKNIAGIGNIYADEILFIAQISPFAKVEEIDEEKKERLFFSIKEVLKNAIVSQGTSLGKGLSNFKTPKGEYGRNFEGLKVYGQQGLNCLRCGMKIQKCKFASRGTHFCPNCQPTLNYEGFSHRC